MAYKLRAFFAIVATLLVVGCEPSDQDKLTIAPETIQAGDECHLCGMAIQQFPGPKGEAWDSRTRSIKKFCSTKELMIWALQPENQASVKKLFVHDMAKSAWQHPDDHYLVDASVAWYVVGSSQMGSMGKTLASFKLKADAEKFSAQYGGQVKGFKSLSLESLIRE